MKFIFSFLFLLLLLFPLSSFAQDNVKNSIAVIELFTGRGCMDAAPADDVLKSMFDKQYSYDGDVILLSCHVMKYKPNSASTSLAHKFCGERQILYNRAHVSGNIVIPQIILNGKFDMGGDKEHIIDSGIKMAHSLFRVGPLDVYLDGEELKVNLPNLPLDSPIDLWVMGYEHMNNIELEEDVAGVLKKTVRKYANIVRHIEKIPLAGNYEKAFSYSLKEMPADGYAVIIQYSDLSEMLFAGKIEHFKPENTPLAYTQDPVNLIGKASNIQ